MDNDGRLTNTNTIIGVAIDKVETIVIQRLGQEGRSLISSILQDLKPLGISRSVGFFLMSRVTPQDGCFENQGLHCSWQWAYNQFYIKLKYVMQKCMRKCGCFIWSRCSTRSLKQEGYPDHSSLDLYFDTKRVRPPSVVKILEALKRVE